MGLIRRILLILQKFPNLNIPLAMKKFFASFLFVFLSVSFVFGNTDYEQVLQERNMLYNDAQSAMLSDTISDVVRLQMWQSLIQKDNQIIDEWIPFLQTESDSLKIQLGVIETSFAKTKSEMQERQDVLLYAGAGAAGLFLLFFILFIAVAVGKSKTKKKLKLALISVKEHDRLLEVHQNTKSLLDSADDKVEELKKSIQMKTNEIETQKTLVSETEQKFSSQITQLKNEKLQIEQELSELKISIADKEKNLNEIHIQHNTQLAEKDFLIAGLTNELQLLKNSTQHNDCKANEEEIDKVNGLLEHEREENIKRLHEKELLMDEFRKEIHELRTALDEKNRDEHQVEFTVQTDLHEEISRLKRVNVDQAQLLEEYRLTLEKELEVRYEIEAMLKDLYQK